VTILEMLSRIGDDIELETRNCVMEELGKGEVELIPEAYVHAVSVNEISYTKSGEEVKIQSDTIVLSMGGRSEDELYDNLADKIVDLHLIGDAKKPRNFLHAVSEGFFAAYDK